MAEMENWLDHVNNQVAQGRLADALAFLEHECKTASDSLAGQNLSKQAKLIEICYSQLNHNKANQYATELQSSLSIKNIRWFTSLVISYLICINFLVTGSASRILTGFIRKKWFSSIDKNTKWEHVNSILFAKFWHNIRECIKYPILQLILCEDSSQNIFSFGMLGYSLSYSGHNYLGNKVLQKSINIAKDRRYTKIVSQLYPHLAIGYGMAANPDRAFQVYDEMASTMELTPFYQLVIAANKISLSLADKDLLTTRQAIDNCFSQSFSLANTANHVQIYGGQAIIFAILSKVDEAKSLMKKSKASAETCSAPLNFLFYYRLEALMWYALKENEKCNQCLMTAFQYCKLYGMPKWHIVELNRINSANQAQSFNSFLIKKYYSLSFLGKTLATGNLGLFKKCMRLTSKFIFSKDFNYWSGLEKVEFYETYLKEAAESNSSHLGRTSLTIASAFIDSCKSFSSKKGLDSEGLTQQIRQSLPVTDVICLSSQEEVLSYIRDHYGETNVAVINEKTDKIRMKCQDQGYFICISSPKISLDSKSTSQELHVGILIPQVDIQSEELIEAFLRVMLSQYAFNSSLLLLEEQKRLKVEREAAINQAIANTVQMLAHDVRRPFSMVQGILDVLASTDDAEDAQAFAIKHLPEIKRAIASVTNMLSDVIEVGTQGKLELQSMSPKALVESVLTEHFRYNETANVDITYDYQHDHCVYVDVTKISRVLTNIVVNALQAMSFSGGLTFSTRQNSTQTPPMLHFVTSNTGSFIPESEVAKLFEPYYTKGKKSGTGLGLAIADKIVREHGGHIWCISEKDRGTEFHFTLPLDSGLDQFDGLTFPHSKDIYQHFHPKKEREMDHRIITGYDEEEKFETLAIKLLKEITTNISILITDDEPFYRSILKEQILFNSEISEKIDVSLSSSGEQTLRLCENKVFDVIVMDVDFGPALANGFETVRQLRKNGNTAKILIHSNRGALQYQSMSIEAGADLFIPKPMSRAIFLKIIASVVQEIQGNGNASISA